MSRITQNKKTEKLVSRSLELEFLQREDFGFKKVHSCLSRDSWCSLGSFLKTVSSVSENSLQVAPKKSGPRELTRGPELGIRGHRLSPCHP
jgi:hypothetical protein